MINCKHLFDESGQCFECDEKITASQQAKAAGLKSLAQVSELTGVSFQTLNNWAKHKPQLFEAVLLGCLALTDR